MKKDKIIYWITTGLFSAMMTMSAVNYFTNPEMQATFAHLGYPDYFRIQLGTAKLMGVLALLLPFVPQTFKHFAYAGFTIVTLSASVAHAANGDGAFATVLPIILLGILAVSYLYYQKLKGNKVNS